MNRKPALFALGAIALWALFATLGTQLRSLPPFFVAGAGLCIGSTLSLPHARQWKVAPNIFLNGVFGIFGYHLLIFSAFRHAPTLQANLLSYIWPLLLVLLSPLALPGSRIGLNHILGSLLGFAGAGLIVTGGSLNLVTADIPGYLLALGAALVWACYSVFTRRLPAFNNAAVGGFCLASGLLALLCHQLFEPSAIVSTRQWLVLVLLGAGPMGASYLFWNRAVTQGDPRQIGAMAYVTPLLSTLLLVVCGQAELNSAATLAIFLIMGGAVLGGVPVKEIVRRLAGAPAQV
ncbi:DMT family transporter [Paludibacterium yongneupense]|uniref:DMT family transporter n=1 Tax=Paludibacterium yongneupense TaxID=400061 RepID=UPI0003FF7915|nr:DMT family transporter [Paludibacterium yongneupense]